REAPPRRFRDQYQPQPSRHAVGAAAYPQKVAHGGGEAGRKEIAALREARLESSPPPRPPSSSCMRQIVLDTETTGLDPATHRIIEIGCVELVNHVPTGRNFHKYLNPERVNDVRAFEVHGLSDEFLRGQPAFRDIAGEFLDFLGDDQLVIHNAEFDMGFVNWELRRLDRVALSMARVVDTIA